MTRDARGVALVAVLITSTLIAAAGLGAVLLAHAQVEAGRRRDAAERARSLARAAASAAAGWFEERERGALVSAPRAAEVERDARRVDPDGDGTAALWSAAAPPWNVRYKEADPARLFRPPDGPSPADVFAGDADGPDMRLVEDGPGAGVLVALARALDAGPGARVTALSFFAPQAAAAAGTIATVEARVVLPLAGGGTARAAARADVVALDWGRADRPVVVEGDAALAGDVAWCRGEAVFGGTLSVDAAALAGWPGAIPWFGPDRPLREDNDGDGAPDDADADGAADFEAWRTRPGSVPDPWWRGRVGGEWNGPEAGPGSCATPWPFGPRASPPRPPDKPGDRSGFFVRCPPAVTPDAVPAAWIALAGRGPRGLSRATEDPARPGLFRRDGCGEALSPAELAARAPGVTVLVPDPGRTEPLRFTAGGGAGGIVLTGGTLLVAGGTAGDGPDPAPGAPRDTGGAERAAAAGDDALPLPGSCGAWDPGRWEPGAGAAASHPCPDGPAHWRGLLASAGRLEMTGPLRVRGVVRAGLLTADGAAGAVRLCAGDGAHDPAARAGPPGAPRVVPAGVRDVP